jgi:hypothetical protein
MPLMPMAARRPLIDGRSSPTSATRSASHTESASCSMCPGHGVLTECSRTADAITAPSGVVTTAFELDVPMSRPSRRSLNDGLLVKAVPPRGKGATRRDEPRGRQLPKRAYFSYIAAALSGVIGVTSSVCFFSTVLLVTIASAVLAASSAHVG